MSTIINKTSPISKAILIRAIKSRMFLHIQGFLSDKENDAVYKRICKFQDKHKIEISREEIYGK